MATSSLSLRFGSGSGGSGLHSLLGGGDGDFEGGGHHPYNSSVSVSGSGGPGGGVGGSVVSLSDSLPGPALMTVDTNHHSLLSSLPPSNGDYGPGKMLCLGQGLPDFGGHQQQQGYAKEDFEDKFSGYTSSSLQQQQPPSQGVPPTSSSSVAPKGGPKLKTEREILNNDLNIVSEGQNDVTIEYMDLDEFLHENGLSNVCKGDDPLGQHEGSSHLSSSLEKHYPVSLQQRGSLGHPSDPPSGPGSEQSHLLTAPVSASASSLTCIIPSIGGGSGNPGSMGGGHRGLPPLDVYGGTDEHNRQCSPGSNNSLASPSSGCSTELGASGRGRRRSSTKSIDSCRSLSPGTDGESLIGGKNSLDGRVIKRSKKEMVPDIKKDANYWKKREKNNLAAKRSRDSRREREAQISFKTKFLESENASLQQKVEKCLRQIEDLKKRLSKYEPL